MVFNSLHFVAFFAVVFALYRLLPHRGQNALLLVAGYYFYASWEWRFLGVLIALTIVTYGCGIVLGRPDDRWRKAALTAGVGVNLAALGYFKYAGFFAENLRALLEPVGWRLDGPSLNVLLPVGVSFYVFVAMAYLVDVHRRQTPAARNLLDFAVFIGYFPTLLAGPIMRASSLLRQISAPRAPATVPAGEGAWLILWGLFKKVFVADNLARVVDAVYSPNGSPGGMAVVLGTVAFAFQIYGDFSGYSDIARGISKLLGIELAVNFRFPYFVRTPQAFWMHWHISLSEWLRDYVFLPMSFASSRRLDGVRWLGLRDDFWIYCAAATTTMLLAGLWHGAGWTFVLWGAYQAGLLVGFRLLALLGRRGKRPTIAGWSFHWNDVPAALLMFALTCLGWLVFRADSLTHIVRLSDAIFTSFQPSRAVFASVGTPLLAYAGPLLVLLAAMARHGTPDSIADRPRLVRYTVYVALVYAIVLFGNFEGSEFLYFQF
jgi:D-alanyl-lipoteichoic acid acyltransferase DltB (MBOAT superfamily)